MTRQPGRALCAAGLMTALLTFGAFGQEREEKLGTLSFPTSCDPKVQAQFERGVAMLHSYWFTEGGKVFDAVAKQDPSCVMAYWGYAVNQLGNSLSSPPSAKDAQMAWD